MKKLNFAIAMMMEMCMQACCMCMSFCAYNSDVFSISKAKHFVA